MNEENVKHAYENTDVELFRERDDYYAPSVHVTKDSWIGMSVGGMVHSMPIVEWHMLAKKHFKIKQIQGMSHKEIDS